MYTFYIQSVLTILMLHTIQILSMQQSNEIKLLECAQDHVRGKSLLEQNEYFLPTNVHFREQNYIIKDSFIKGLAESDIAKQLPVEIIYRICDFLPQNCISNLMFVNKDLARFVKALGMKNILTIYRAGASLNKNFLLTHYIPVLPVKSSLGGWKYY